MTEQEHEANLDAQGEAEAEALNAETEVVDPIVLADETVVEADAAAEGVTTE